MLLNLLSNAIKFTPEGGRVEAAATILGGRMTLTVRDNGIGIAAEDLDKALTPFGQVENPLARKYHGTGLGLPLVKELVELHDGSLDITSQPGTGTAVTLNFPAERMIN